LVALPLDGHSSEYRTAYDPKDPSNNASNLPLHSNQQTSGPPLKMGKNREESDETFSLSICKLQ